VGKGMPHLNQSDRPYGLKRLVDVVLSACVLCLMLVPGLIIALLVKLTSRGPAIYWSDRVGRNNVNFRMPKFRTMRIDTPALATHLMHDPDAYLTPLGGFLRKTSLDEIPQLWSILKGDMSLVGPRPALFNQDDLVTLRTSYGVDRLQPGLTGWAQINGRDEIPIADKVKLDVEYLQRQTFMFDMKILLLTIVRVLHRHGVAH
jgi:O-antigen biosynthesis protein WbqP